MKKIMLAMLALVIGLTFAVVPSVRAAEGTPAAPAAPAPTEEKKDQGQAKAEKKAEKKASKKKAEKK